jgi:hypothetical protein
MRGSSFFLLGLQLLAVSLRGKYGVHHGVHSRLVNDDFDRTENERIAQTVYSGRFCPANGGSASSLDLPFAVRSPRALFFSAQRS